MSSLYRKYRPQTFGQVIGQNHVKITIQHEIERGEIGHAYLFCGPRGLGKTTTARLLAKSINCEDRKDGESEPCNKCSSCLDITANRSIDIIEIDAASHTGVDNVRENIIENARFTPTKSKYKVFIIDEVHMLSTSAFNALLKTLEEPPKHAIFILCTTEIHKLPQTIISRCQRFDLKKIPAQDMLQLLEYIVKEEGKKVDTQVLKNIVVHSEGCARDAESLLGKILTLGDSVTQEQAELILPRSDFSSIASFLDAIVGHDATSAIGIINRLVEDGVDLQSYTDSLLEFLRKILLIKVNGSLSDFGIELDEESHKSAERLAEKFNYAKLLSAIELFTKKGIEIKSAGIQQLPLELAVIELTESIVCSKDDDFKGSGSGESVREKIKETLSHLNPIKSKPVEVAVDKEVVVAEEKEEIQEEAPLAIVEEETVEQVEAKENSTDEISEPDKSSRENVLDLKDVKEKWPDIVERLLEKNYTLSSMLKISQPLRVKGNMLEIGVKSNFYKSRLDDHKSRAMLQELISEILSADVAIMGVVKEDIVPLIKSAYVPSQGSQPIAPIPPVNKDVVQDVMGMF